jgi:guanylate kinase
MANKLEHLEEFKEILKHYQMSEHALRVLSDIQFVMMVAPSSSGRNTIINELVKTGKYRFVISDTTRQPRVNNGVLEQKGVEYWFKTEEKMLNALRAGEMLEAEVIHRQQVSGISIAELERAKDEGKIAITDMDIGGVENVLKHKPDAVVLFLLPPNFDEWMNRMNARGQMPDDEKHRRLHTAVKLLKKGLQIEEAIFVVNDEFHQTAKIVNQIRESKPDQKYAKQTAEKLLRDTEDYLTKQTHHS